MNPLIALGDGLKRSRKVKESSGIGVKPKQATESFSTSNVAERRTWRSGQGREETKKGRCNRVFRWRWWLAAMGSTPTRSSTGGNYFTKAGWK
jgi:hypothetical protein